MDDSAGCWLPKQYNRLTRYLGSLVVDRRRVSPDLRLHTGSNSCARVLNQKEASSDIFSRTSFDDLGARLRRGIGIKRTKSLGPPGGGPPANRPFVGRGMGGGGGWDRGRPVGAAAPHLVGQQHLIGASAGVQRAVEKVAQVP